MRWFRGLMTLGLILAALAPGGRAGEVNVRVRVCRDTDLAPLGGVYLRLLCPDDQVDFIQHTDPGGQAAFHFDHSPTAVPARSSRAVAIRRAPSPNPAQGRAVVAFMAPADGAAADARVALHDLRGRRLARGRLADGRLRLPSSGLPAGVYVLRCQDGPGVVTTCRLTVVDGPLREICFEPSAWPAADTARDKSVRGFNSRLLVRCPGYQDLVVNDPVTGMDQELEVRLERIAGHPTGQTWILASDHGWNTAAADSGWVSAGPDTGLVYDRVIVDTDGTRHALAQLDGRDVGAEACSDWRLIGRSSHDLSTHPPIVPVIYFDLTELPAGITIDQAWLVVSPAPGSQILHEPGAWHAAILDVWREDEAWLSAPNNQAGTDPDVAEHFRRVSWRYVDAADRIPWWPWLDQRTRYDEYGIQSLPVKTVVRDGHCVRYDVTRAVQAWADHRESLGNAGFWLGNSSSPTTYAVAAGPAASVSSRQPLLQITFRGEPHTIPWNGHPLAFSFQTDDGDTATSRYAEIMEAHDARLTAFVMRTGVREFAGVWSQVLDIQQWRDLAARGHEIGHHSDHHQPVWGLAEITWGAVDSMQVELARDTWLAEVFPDSLLPDGEPSVLAYPNGGVSLWAIKNLVAEQFLLGRCAGSGEGWSPPGWAGAGWSTYLSWYDPVNLYNVAITGDHELVGDADDEVTLADIRLNLRRVSARLLNQGQGALFTFCHSTKQSPTYPRGIDYDELDWLLTAVEESGLYWVTTCGDAARCYRASHQPTEAMLSPGIAAYDSLATLGHGEFDQVWWIDAPE